VPSFGRDVATTGRGGSVKRTKFDRTWAWVGGSENGRAKERWNFASGIRRVGKESLAKRLPDAQIRGAEKNEGNVHPILRHTRAGTAVWHGPECFGPQGRPGGGGNQGASTACRLCFPDFFSYSGGTPDESNEPNRIKRETECGSPTKRAESCLLDSQWSGRKINLRLGSVPM